MLRGPRLLLNCSHFLWSYTEDQFFYKCILVRRIKDSREQEDVEQKSFCIVERERAPSLYSLAVLFVTRTLGDKCGGHCLNLKPVGRLRTWHFSLYPSG